MRWFIRLCSCAASTGGLWIFDVWCETLVHFPEVSQLSWSNLRRLFLLKSSSYGCPGIITIWGSSIISRMGISELNLRFIDQQPYHALFQCWPGRFYPGKWSLSWEQVVANFSRHLINHVFLSVLIFAGTPSSVKNYENLKCAGCGCRHAV